MLYHLRGTLERKTPTYVVMDCGGVGYLIHISLTTFGQLPDLGKAELLLHPVYREDAQLLFGFATELERDVFVLLNSVSGVGASTARVILSTLRPEEALSVIANGDSGSLQRIKGIGAKTAQRIIIDIRDKAIKLGALAPMAAGGTSARQEALEALLVLGFARVAVEKVLAALSAEELEYSLEDLIKRALARL
ncbi:MAG: Holliday junction branch migration protein RuvA [Schleiferiaceae bacterium]|jgi:holliday junction DNA helicase RuvA|nr:Holliday junction branch migration protein RuvA [Schleiferiaceae bacterium]MDP4628256.1 Holliday junction branch migration protein RuvA [Schleiferiaceae bacterium]MDP4742263.1 Holliday junction branch migration protein RuvA [Schleiferiaceae bacterium]MDP4773557.1 Holliday junction branch migration protein RuvA [Schleiferiaceae bacterium]MDP4854927.1 Holliday junction branch migration protein RuvA [Schleiferiaceae bacterium]